MANPTYATTRGRRVASIVLGALLGGATTAAPSVLLFTERGHLSAAGVFGAVIVSITGWLLGILVLGLPVWWLVERTPLAPTRRAALLCGAVLPPLWFFLFMILLDVGTRQSTSDSSSMFGVVAFIVAIPVAGLGMGVAWAMWRLAYRRTVTPAIADTFS